VTNPTRGKALARAVRRMEAAGLPTSRRDAELLVEWAAETSRVGLYTHPEIPLTAPQFERLRRAIRRRAEGYPLAYLLGEQEFYGRRFQVSEAVLIPRADTETVVELALQLVAEWCGPAVLDVGTGSGCIGITLACERPDSRVTLTDLSDDALEVAAGNAQHLGVADRVSLILADLVSPAAAPVWKGPSRFLATSWPGGARFDLIVSNPPYVACDDHRVAQEVRQWEPAAAVFSGPSGYEVHQRLLAEAKSVLAPDGRLVLEIGQGQEPEVADLAVSHGWELLQARRDLAGITRALAFKRRSEDQPGQVGSAPSWVAVVTPDQG
jgi:release factor glutamine methyltransferase